MSAPTVAILGATGQTGNAILHNLTTEHPNIRINALVRSRAKLTRMLPANLPPTALQIHEGTINNVPLLTACLRNTTAVFLTVATMDNTPHCRIARETAEAVIAALQILRDESSTTTAAAATKLPTLVFLSSAETQENPFMLETPWLVRRMLFAANYWIYTDLIAAERYLRTKMGEMEGLDVVFFKPGGILHGSRSGHVLSVEESMTFISFSDVAGAMVECALDGERWAGKGVSVLAEEKVAMGWAMLVGVPLVLVKNLLATVSPWLYQRLF